MAAFSGAEDFNPSLLSSFLGEAGFFDPSLETWSGVPLPLVSALAAVPPVDAFSAALVLTLALSLALDLLIGLLLIFVASDF